MLRKVLTVVVSVLIGGAILYCALAWMNNISIVAQWNPERAPNAPGPKGIMPRFDWSAVDLSTVTTFVPMLGLALILSGVIRIGRRHEKLASPYFPFFQGHDAFMVTLGLIGTVAGLIMYGYYDQTGRTLDQRLKDLMVCLRTALYSTQMALVWVFLLIYPLRPAMRWLYNLTADAPQEKKLDQRPLAEKFESLSTAVGGTGSQMGKLHQSSVALTETMAELKGAMAAFILFLNEFRQKTGVDVQGAMANALSQMQQVLKAISSDNEATREASQKQAAAAAKMLSAVKSLKKDLATDRTEANRQTAILLQPLISAVAGLKTVLTEDRAALRQALQAIEEDLRRRLTEAQDRVTDAEERIGRATIALSDGHAQRGGRR